MRKAVQQLPSPLFLRLDKKTVVDAVERERERERERKALAHKKALSQPPCAKACLLFFCC
jgi:hypothetical protein